VARHVSVQLVDDVDGGPAAETVDFGLDGVHYTIDLSKDNAAQLRSVLAPYLRRARTMRRTGGGGGGGGTRQRRRAATDSTALIRDLAERARSRQRAEPAEESAGESTEESAGESTEEAQPAQPDEGTTGAATAARPELTAVVEPPEPDPESQEGAPPPLAPVFQPPQR
jgi:hypothetical protein